MSHPPEHWGDFVVGALEPRAEAEMREHLIACAACRREVEGWSRIRQRLQALEDHPAPAGLRSRVLETVSAPPRLWDRVPPWTAALAALRGHPLARPALTGLAAGVLLAVLAGWLLAQDAVRAAFGELLSRVRVVPIEELRPPPAPRPEPGTRLRTPAPGLHPGATPIPGTLQGLTGETTLAELEARATFPVSLPAYLGRPDRVYFQDPGFLQMAILVWLDQAGQPDLALFEMEGFVQKGFSPPATARGVEVDGRPALWFSGGEHLVQFGSGRDWQPVRLVEGSTLVWDLELPGRGQPRLITYRLETGLPLGEAVRIAESLEVRR